ncbi:phage tail component [Escherichia coli]|nr:phage tail component [Escherichia coli]
MPQLKGIIKSPTGEPSGGTTITLTSLHNQEGVLKGVFSHITTENGEYDFPILPGVYRVRLTNSAQRLSEIGIIRVYEDSEDGSLNDFLGKTNIDLRPESLKKFEELARQAKQSAEDAGKHAADAEFILSLIEKTPPASYSTDSVIPLMINRTQLQSAHKSRAEEPLMINGVQIQFAHRTGAGDPLVIKRAGLSVAFTTPHGD